MESTKKLREIKILIDYFLGLGLRLGLDKIVLWGGARGCRRQLIKWVMMLIFIKNQNEFDNYE